MLPLTLVQDDPFVIRIVAGAPLTDQEHAEWVARVDWHLNVPDGRLCVTGGSVLTSEDYDADDPHEEQYVGEVALPRGRYRAALYTHVHGVNGGSVLDFLAGGHGQGESPESWFARTRPGEPRPDWDGMELVHFLLYLEPVDVAPSAGLSELPEDGWFNGAENARKPERCPSGLVAADVQRTVRDESPGDWTYVRSVFDSMPAIDRTRVAGGTVSLPLESLARAIRIGWFGSRYIQVELRLTPPSGASLGLGREWPEGMVAVEEDGVGRVLFDSDLDINTILTRLPELAVPLAAVRWHADGPLLRADRGDAGLVALRGGTWRIEQAWPATDAATLDAALSLAAEVERGTTIALRDEPEGTAILAWARRNFGEHPRGNPPRVGDGAIRFKKAGHEVALLGIAAFAHRFARTWPVVDLAGE
ncbi:MAG: hypothetical protein IT177_05075 [Acidobacteria bacterium]|nr:hypothetical protein [Acidobacteriota bacterium]